MNDAVSLYAALAVCVVLSLVFLIFGLKVGSLLGRLRAERSFDRMVRDERRDAVKRSRAVLGGQLSEQMAAFFPGFPADPSDARFIGKPVDFICFTGLSGGTVTDITFVEVKTGQSNLSPVERSVRNAIEAGRVHYTEYRIPEV
ncbi:MAG TPA: Holliday junction resolvase-like protein [Treponemataceae bacterium]|nr:Holliday junction resolvase-like protein [Treponemataceae bacterium]